MNEIDNLVCCKVWALSCQILLCFGKQIHKQSTKYPISKRINKNKYPCKSKILNQFKLYILVTVNNLFN